MSLISAFASLDKKDKFGVALGAMTLVAGIVFSVLSYVEARQANETSQLAYKIAKGNADPRYHVSFLYNIKRGNRWSQQSLFPNAPANISRAEFLSSSSNLQLVITNTGTPTLVINDIALLAPRPDEPDFGFWITRQKLTKDCSNSNNVVGNITCYDFPLAVKDGEQRTLFLPFSINGQDILNAGATRPVMVGIASNTPAGFHSWTTNIRVE